MQRPIGIALLVLGIARGARRGRMDRVEGPHVHRRSILWFREGLGWPSRDRHHLSGGRALPSRCKSANELAERRTFPDLALRGVSGRMSVWGQTRRFDDPPVTSGPLR
jgi:hypothetical protein